MSGWWRNARTRRRAVFAVCGTALVALAVVLHDSRDKNTAGVLVSVIAAVVSVAAFLADALRDGAEPQRPAEDVRRQTADALALAVREQWAAESRLRRLQDPGPLEVRWAPADRWLVDHPENIRPGVPLPAPRNAGPWADGIAGAFAALPRRRLVVLGGPGSGKSVLALRFTLGQLAVREPGGPVPVIFPLASWDPRGSRLRDWLAERLAADHRLLAASADGRPTLARALLDTGLILPVLDGFDELPRSAYAEAVRHINSELDDDLPLLLTSRTEAWAATVRAGDVLTAAEVVELLPLDEEQAGSYLERTARPGGRDGAHGETVWTPVLRRLAREPHPLADVLRVPLMVALARTVYGDTSRDPAELLDPGRFPTAGDIEEHLLDAFVPAAFADCGPERGAEARRRLALLARNLERRGTGRLAWWELDSALPGLVRAYATGLVALAATLAILPAVALARASDHGAGTQDSASVLVAMAGQTLGYAFGAAFLLPRRRGPLGRRDFLSGRLAITTVVATALWTGFALTDDLRFGFRFGAVTDGLLPDLFGSCLFALLLTMFFGVAGLPRRPVPLGLPWAGHQGRATVLVCGAVLLACGVDLVGAVLLGVAVTQWTALAGAMCAVAGTALLLGGTRRAVRDSPSLPGRSRISRDFTAGLARGLAATLLIGVVASSVAGTAAVAVTVLKSGTRVDLDGQRIGEWRFLERNGLRTATTHRRLKGTLLVPDRGRLAVAYPAGTTPPSCEIPLLPGRRCAAFSSWHTVFESRAGSVTVRLTPGDTTAPGADRRAYAANMRSVLPEPARAWLTDGPVLGLVARCLPPILASGLLVGLVGGCVCGVYRALSAPSDVVRAAGPRSTLRTDRTASLARGGIAALLAAVVCLPVVLLSHDWGGVATAGAQLWVPVGATALALSAWGRFLVTRVWLAATGRAPWRLMAFLDEAHRRGVLRQSGAYYEFRHQRLQRRLAGAVPAGASSVEERLDVLG
ncbi:NACHT domain-containing protein [Streptomyces sp. NPDC057757]|uniref:NACHT domain-containing protein n=1 Tax=Streptomyces sp. NPDC057757 TaxID=3346241 RepID=UPI0036986889